MMLTSRQAGIVDIIELRSSSDGPSRERCSRGIAAVSNIHRAQGRDTSARREATRRARLHARAPVSQSPPLTLSALIAAYTTDPDSPFLRKVRFNTRQNYRGLLDRIELNHGHVAVDEIHARLLLRWHEDWSAGNRTAMAHALVGMLRTLATFGATMMERQECRSLKVTLHDMRFPMPKPRTETLTSAQVIAIRRKAHDGKPGVRLISQDRLADEPPARIPAGHKAPLDDRTTAEMMADRDGEQRDKSDLTGK